MSNIISFQKPIPSYSVDLLMAARRVIHASPDMLPQHLKLLQDAVIAFEGSMPLNNEGEIQEYGRAE